MMKKFYVIQIKHKFFRMTNQIIKKMAMLLIISILTVSKLINIIVMIKIFVQIPLPSTEESHIEILQRMNRVKII